MKHILSVFLCACCALCFCSFDLITLEDLKRQGVDDEVLEQIQTYRIYTDTTDVVVKFPECNASLTVPEGFKFLDKDDSRTLLCGFWNNPEDRIENLLGTLVPRDAEYFYQVPVAYVITYDNCGYVPDDDASDIDYDDLLEELKKACKEANKDVDPELRLDLIGWAAKPKYMPQAHALVWAKRFKQGTTDEVINYDMRILSREGMVSINAIASPEQCSEVIALESEIISSLHFDSGHAYSDFNPSTDKKSDWTLGGLIAGGILAKTGILGKIGLLLVKFGKFAWVAIAAAVMGIVKFFRGKRKDDEE